MGFFRFFHKYIVRDLLRHRARFALTIAGIALGIGVVVAVQLAVSRAIASFNDSVDLLAGTADLAITANGRALPEEIIRKLDWIWDYGAMTPIVEGRALSDQGPVQVFGVDLLSEGASNDYLNDRSQRSVRLTREEFLDLVLDPKAVIVTEAFAKRSNA